MSELLAVVRSVFEWLDALPSSIALRESQYVWSWMVVAHVLGVSWFAGLIFLMDLRLLGRGFRTVSFGRLQRRLFPWQMAGMAVSVLTGLALVYAQPLRYLGSVYFWMKMAAMGVAGLNAIAFHYVTYPSVAEDERRPLPLGARLAGALGLFLWATVVLEGRLIPYSITWFPHD